MSKKFSRKSILSNFLVGTKIGFMRIHKVALFISLFLTLSSIILVANRGFNLGIDFSGGILIEVKFQENVELPKLRNLLDNRDLGEVTLQNFDAQNFMIKVAQDTNVDQASKIKQIKEIIGNNFSNVEYRKVDFVGPQIGKELITKGIMALILSFAAIMIYIWIRFDWQFGVGAIISLIHDTTMILGLFAITGLEFNSTSIAAILTIIGYSINDSVVIYDRIRENLHKFKKANLSDLIDLSLNSTLSRTVLTSGATLVSLAALIIFGGEALRSFSIAVFFGIIIGTYSSIYISAPILLYLDPRKKKLPVSQ
ncbi:MAG: preprotein translocase subunit SecF [Rickettsiales bacterium]|jgi:preprotein translocase subunit SecF